MKSSSFKRYSYTFFILLICLSCTGNFERVPIERFQGTWKLVGRSMFEGVVIEIQENEKGHLEGKIKELNDNKYVALFAEVGDVWISSISRNSNFQFQVVENKIAKELFGLYGISTSTEFKAEFINQNTIALSNSGNPSNSSIKYIRIEE